MAPEVCAAAGGALVRGGVTALAVAALLLLAQRRGRSVAGLLAGLPTVTGPALLWLALDRGPAFAAEAAVGAVAAGLCCALFALAYGWAGRRFGPAGTLSLATAASALPLPWLADASWTLSVWWLLASLACWACRWCLVPRATDPGMVPAAPSAVARRGWLATAAVSGLVSALASAAAGVVGPFWAGLLTSPPLLAAAVALELHRQARQVGPVLPFLHGYVTGLIGRGLFAVAVGALVQPLGTAQAFALALAASLLAGRLSHHRVHANLKRQQGGTRLRA